MSQGFSIFASTALNALHASGFLNSIIRGSICDPALGGSVNHPNAAFFADVEWYLTCREVAYAGDTLNTYCQSILAEVLDTDHSTWPLVKKMLRAKTRDEAVGNLRIQREIDGRVREALREGLSVLWCGEMEIIAELRNRIVHQAGMDPEGKIPETISNFPPGNQLIPPASLDPAEFPVTWDPCGKLSIDAKTGYWATQHVLNHIHLMDQTLCHRFNLARCGPPIRKIGFTVSGNSSILSTLPGTPLPLLRSDMRPPSPTLHLPPAHEYTTMTTPEEVACATTWNRVRGEIFAFVQKYCEQVGVELCGLDTTLAGSIVSHTIEGHDQHMGFDLRPKEGKADKPKFLGVRFRQANFQPFLTIWGTHAQMRDFACEMTEQFKEYLQGCINHSLSH